MFTVVIGCAFNEASDPGRSQSERDLHNEVTNIEKVRD